MRKTGSWHLDKNVVIWIYEQLFIWKGDEMSKIYILENLGCANCAAKMEKKINEIDDNYKELGITVIKVKERLDNHIRCEK